MDIVRRLRNRYVTALVLLGVLATAANVVLQHEMSRQDEVAARVNVAGRQRMLSQRSARLLLERLVARDEAERRANRDALDATLDRMEREHDWLLEESLPPDLHAHYFGDVALDARVRAYLRQVRTLADQPADQLATAPGLHETLAHSRTALLRDLNTAVGLRQARSEADLARMEVVEHALLALQVVALVLVGVFLIAPTLAELRRRLAALHEQQRRTDLVLAYATDGLVLVTPEGRVDTASATASAWFGPPVGRFLWHVVCGDDDDATGFQLGWDQVAEGFLPLEVALGQLPVRIAADDRTLHATYTPIHGEDGSLAYVLAHLVDISDRLALEAQEARQNDLLAFSRAVATDPNAVGSFLRETERILADLAQHDTDHPLFRRGLHTVKGNAAVLGLAGMAGLAHDLESLLAAEASLDPRMAIAPLRTRYELLADHATTVLTARDDRLDVDRDDHAQLVDALVARGASDLAERLDAWRLPRLRTAMVRLVDHADRLAGELGKDLDVRVVDNDLRAPSEPLEGLWAAALHVVRNSLDHGVEAPEIRRAAGKDPTATFTVVAERLGDRLRLYFDDDGQGIDWSRVLAKAEMAGLPVDTDEDRLRVLLADGISSRDEVTEMSGRGVGMAAFHQEVEDLGGTLSLASEAGRGTTWTVELSWSSLQGAASGRGALRALDGGRTA